MNKRNKITLRQAIIVIVLTIAAALLISLPAWANDVREISIGTGQDYLDVCQEELEKTPTLLNRPNLPILSFCLGYINGMAQMSNDKTLNGIYIKDLAFSYLTYLHRHPDDLHLDNSVLFRRMLSKK